jgi:hypothetical protein
MRPDASFHPFTKETWQAVTTQARHALVRKEFCAEQSRIESMRYVYLSQETETSFGRQIWFFEAIGVDPVGKQHQLYGALEFSVQFGLMEPCRAALMEDPAHRQRFLHGLIEPVPVDPWSAPSTKVLVHLTFASVAIIASVWVLTMASCLLDLQ